LLRPSSHLLRSGAGTDLLRSRASSVVRCSGSGLLRPAEFVLRPSRQLLQSEEVQSEEVQEVEVLRQ
jgi:hypothetical protein